MGAFVFAMEPSVTCRFTAGMSQDVKDFTLLGFEVELELIAEITAQERVKRECVCEPGLMKACDRQRK